MQLLSKKSLLITILCLTSYFNISAADLSIRHGVSLLNISYLIQSTDSYGSVDIIRYRMIEEVTGLGFSIYLANMGLAGNMNDIFNDEESFFDFEVNWEPSYKHDYPYGFGLFYRIGGYLPIEDTIDHRFGLRGDLRLPVFFPDFIYTPLVTLDTGYCMKKGIYIELKADLLTDLYFVLKNTL